MTDPSAEPLIVEQVDRIAADQAFDVAFRGDTNGIEDAMASLFVRHRQQALATVEARIAEAVARERKACTQAAQLPSNCISQTPAPLLAENAKLRELLETAVDDHDSHNGRSKNSVHWSNQARAALAKG